MKRIVSPCRIRVGKRGVKYPQIKMERAIPPDCPGDPVDVQAEAAVCNRCHHTLDFNDLFERDLRVVTCSNCYSDSITLTAIRFEVWTKKDWEECTR